MKNLNYLMLLVISLGLFLNSSCNNDDDDGVSVGGDGCSASWKVDGVDYSIDDLAFCVYLDNTLNLGANTTGGDFQLQIDPITTTGTYMADPQNQDLNVFISITLNDGTLIGSANATVVVTELSSSKAKGTFSGDFFDLADINFDPVFSVTNGSFTANF